MVDDSLKEAIVSVRNGSQTRNKTEASIREMKTMLLELFEELKRNITSYWMSQVNLGKFGLLSYFIYIIEREEEREKEKRLS